MTLGQHGGSSVVRGWQLADTLKGLRDQAGLTQDQAVVKLKEGAGRWSAAKLSRIETRVHRVKPREVDQLLDAYGVADSELRFSLIQLTATSSEQGWWVSFGDELPGAVKPLLSIEGGLEALHDFQPQLLHGLLQTPDYARAVMNAVWPGGAGPDELERRVTARMIRQHVLERESPPRAHFIIDQAVLERVVGTPDIMRAQLRKLLDVAERPHVNLQVLPWSAGGTPGLEGPFAVLSLPDPIPDIGYTEGPAGILYVEDRDRVRWWTLRFGILTELALSCAESAEAIAEAMDSYE
ncbi:helix-turn-helix domain-containing protein [Streptomyces corynorhini]|uniref:XRE family transcriptional regulator n=1 Tax=Streptomyces corynorhini TaxID=2282652 RepID=A0A370AYR9_9ACTN|nr:helix-turn-helix transcriptional regulator [Streptomyces corynorhini]RDG34481.1 XRE family transcriptional regulator [Streptomyces corynorhini]